MYLTKDKLKITLEIVREREKLKYLLKARLEKRNQSDIYFKTNIFG